MTAAVIAANSTDQSPPVSRPQANVVATIVLELVQPPVVSRDFLDEHRLSTADEPRSAVRRTQRYPILVVPPSETGCNRPREVHRRVDRKRSDGPLAPVSVLPVVLVFPA